MPLLLDPVLQTEKFRPLLGPEDSAPASGMEGLAVDNQVIEMLKQWLDRSKYEVIGDPTDTDYQHVPLKMVGVVRVRYKQSEPLLPRRFSAEDE